MKENKIIMFGEKKIRRVLHNGEWFFSVIDIVGVLSGSGNPRNYWKVLKHRLNEEGSEMVTNCNQLKMKSSDGKKYLTDCADKKGIFRIIQSIPSKKAEPFKLWLAQVGSERIDEIENPELAQNRAKEYYEKKGYPKDWVDKRIRGIAVRLDLTDEWKRRGVEEGREYGILTNEISKATFGVSIKDHKKIKNLNVDLKNENLRDSMTDLELIFFMLGEASTTEIVKNKDVLGFDENKVAAQEGGKIAGDARKRLEEKSGKKIVSKKNSKEIILDKEVVKKSKILIGGNNEI
jgi:DNA-damage-inducible protein D